MAKSFSVSFNINGSLDGSLQAAIKAAANSMRGLGSAAKSASAAAQASKSGFAGMAAGLNQLQAAAQKFRDLKKALVDTSKGLQEAQANANKMAAQFRQEQKAAEQLRTQLNQLRTLRTQSEGNVSAARENLAYLRRQREELKAQAKALGATKGRKIPRELLGTAQGEKLAQVLSQLNSNSTAIDAARSKFRETRDELNLLVQKVREAEQALKTQERAVKQSGQGFEQAKAKAAALKESLRQQQEAVSKLRSSLGSSGFSTASFAASERQLAAEIDRVNAALQRQQQLSQAQSRSAQASQEMFNAYNNFQGALSTAGAIAQPFQSAVENAMTFEHAMSRVKALTQTSNIRAGNTAQVEADMAKLEAQARELGATTQFTMTQAADAMGYLGMAGWKTEQIYGTMRGMLNLAAGAGTDLARTADIVSDNMTAMGVPVEKAGHFMDVYAYALTNSNVNLESLGETMKYAAPVAATFGATLEDTAAMAMMMGNAGIKGSMAGTALRMGLLRLSGPPKKASKEMDELGISVSDATAMALESAAECARLGVEYDKNAPPMEKMGNIISQLSTKMQGLSREEKLASIGAIFGANAASGWVNIIEQGPEVFQKYLNELKNCDGYSEQFAHTMNDDTRGAMIALESAVDAVINSVGTALLPAVRAAAEAFAPLATAAAEFISAHPGIVQAAAAIAAALASVVVGAAAVKLAFAGWSFITSSITLVRAALATLADGALLGGLIGRLAALRTALFGLGGAATFGGWSAMFGNIASAATNAAASVRKFFVTFSASQMLTNAATSIKNVGTALMAAGRAAMSFAFSPVGVALMALALAGMYCYENWDKVAPIFSNVASVITGMFAPAVEAIMPAIRNLGRAFDLLKPAIENAFSGGGLATIGSTIVQGLAMAVTAVAGVAATIITAFSNVATTVVQMLTLITGAIRNVFEGNWSAAADKILNVFKTAIEGIKNLFTGLGESIMNTFDSIAKVKDIFNFSDAMPTTDAVARHNSLASAPATSAPAQPEAAPIDTSATQAALDQVGDAASNAATNMDGVNQATEQISQAGTDVQSFAQNAQQAGTEVQQLSSNAQQAGSNVQSFGTQAQAAQAGVDALAGSASSATGGIEALSSASSSAAGSVSGLGAAAQAACQQLSQAGAQAAAAVTSAAAGVKSNATGGIYPKGQFLTTFAEKSPEAAIPIDNSQRAKDLWYRTGQMLGTVPGTADYDSAPKDALGNLKGVDVPEYNKIGEGDTIAVKRAKMQAQREQFNRQTPKLPAIQQSQRQASPSRDLQRQTSSINRQRQRGSLRPPIMDDINRRINDVKLPSGYTIGDALKYLPKQQKSFMPSDVDLSGGLVDSIPKALSPPSSIFDSTFNKFPSPSGGLGGLMNKIPFVDGLIGTLSSQIPTGGGLIGDLLGGLTGGQSNSGGMTFQVTINVTANGSDENSIKRGVESAIPSLEDWANKFFAHQHEQARRSLA